MLLTFEVTNYRSFMDTATLYFTKRSFKTNHPADGDWNAVVNPAVGIWGPNASGKSNLLKALIDVKDAIRYSYSVESELKSLWQPHKLAVDEPVKFFMDSVIDDVRFRWALELNSEGVVEEEISINESRQWKKIITRIGNKVDFGSSSGIAAAARSFIREATDNWSLSASAWLRTKTPGPYGEGFKESIDLVMPISYGSPGRRVTSAWTTEIIERDKWRDLASRVLELADIGVSEIGLIVKPISPSHREFLGKLASVINSHDTGQSGVDLDVPETSTELELKHKGPDGSHFELSFEDESVGTQTWLETAVPALYMIAKGGVLVIDEIDSSLHPFLVRQLIGLFTSPSVNSTGAQLLFTSHDMTLLGNFPDSVIPADSTWLTEKEKSISSIYSLDEFKLSDTNNFEKRYMQGVFGGVPNVNSMLLAEAYQNLLKESDESRSEIESAKGEV